MNRQPIAVAFYVQSYALDEIRKQIGNAIPLTTDTRFDGSIDSGVANLSLPDHTSGDVHHIKIAAEKVEVVTDPQEIHLREGADKLP